MEINTPLMDRSERSNKKFISGIMALSIGGVAIFNLISTDTSEAQNPITKIVKKVVSSSNGVKLSVESLGNQQAKEVIIGVHGGPGLSHESLKSLEQFANTKRRLVLYDQRGSGNSTKPNNSDYSLASQIKDLEAVRKSINADKVDLVGESWGGLLAAAYTAEYPERVDGLVLLDSAPLNLKAFIDGQNLFRNHIASLQTKGLLPAILPKIENNSCLNRLNALMPAYVSNPIGHTPIETGTCTSSASRMSYADISKDGVLDKYAKDLNNFHGRALVIEGQNDPFGLGWLNKNVELLSSAHTTQLVVKDAGHFPIFEQPKSIVPELNSFLR